MSSSKSPASKVLVNDVFEVKEKDPDGKKFDKGQNLMATYASAQSCISHCGHTEFASCYAVSRIICHSDLYEYVMTLDVNTDIYPVDVSFLLAFAPATLCVTQLQWHNFAAVKDSSPGLQSSYCK